MPDNTMYKDRTWAPRPQAESVLRDIMARLLKECPKAREYQQTLTERCAVRLRDIVDHIAFSDAAIAENITSAGWRETSSDVWENSSGMFPAFVRRDGPPILWVRVESAETFESSTGLRIKIEGAEHGPARRAMVFQTPSAGLGIFERSGHAGYDIPDVGAKAIFEARRGLQAIQARRREFDSIDQGLKHTENLVDALVGAIGDHWACDLWLKAEREYWMRKCAPGRRQKERQDRAGIGWSNIDHHTYDSSRAYFRGAVRILEKLGYKLREMLYAGELAGWGSQVLEQPALKSTIFADVDLAPEELNIDFAHEPLPPLDRHRRAGLVSAMHGESILEAGLNHVAGLYDWRVLHAQLAKEGVEMMAPFSDLDELYQELTAGDWGAVDPGRIDRLEQEGHLPKEEADRIRIEGAIVTHLENIERNYGYKGFNRLGIDSVLRKLDPRAYAGDTQVVQ